MKGAETLGAAGAVLVARRLMRVLERRGEVRVSRRDKRLSAAKADLLSSTRGTPP